jgi:primary-amine oxidase
MEVAVEVIRAEERLSSEARFAAIHVHEPDKDEVYGQEVRNDRLHRSAVALVYDWANASAIDAIVDLEARQVASWRRLATDQPPLRSLVTMRLNEVLRKDPRWVEALRERGIADPSRVVAIPNLAEGARLRRQDGQFVVGAFGFHLDEPHPGGRVERLSAMVNLSTGQVDGVRNRFRAGSGARPYVEGSLTGGASAEQPLPPLDISSPAGPGFEIRGHEVRWGRWRIRVAVHPLRGIEIYDVGFEEAGRIRAILYRASLSEIITPYGDPSFARWYPRDLGDYGLGIYSRSSAVPGSDAQQNAVFAPAVLHDSLGNALEVPRAIAIYERDGGILWRHGLHSRRARQLVLAGFAQVDNYDYVFQWIFSQDGAIDVEVLLSGIVNYNTVRRRRDAGSQESGDSAIFGRIVAPGINAPNHQHFFSFRLDFDIEGPQANRVLEMDVVPAPEGPENPHGEWFVMRERLLETELEARRRLDLAAQRKWKIVSSRARNELDEFPGYVLVPGENAVPLSAPRSLPRRKGGFSEYHLWVTPYQRDEIYAAGPYQNLGLLDQGLPAWTQANRPIADEDIVVWYTLGITHVPRPEDWPIMPVHRAAFRLIPNGFFSRNPAIDVSPGG